ncbi:MAG: ATP-dependent DNA helicase RecG [candidate division WOR-3 bacterium]|nr:ATP-dependent DNA helicase RecG [candidate division WOR-3 bacterium]
MQKKQFLRLDSPVQYIKGIGPKKASYFKKLNIENVKDLLFLVPRRYLDYSNVLKIKDLKINDEATVIGRIHLIEIKKAVRRGEIVNVLLRDETGSVVLRWFNRPDLKNKFKIGDWLMVSGKVTFFYSKQFINPIYEIIGDEESIPETISGTIIPIYPLTEGLSIWDIRRAMNIALELCLDEVVETIPEYILKKNELPAMKKALKDLHFPQTVNEAIKARRRLVYDEFFFFELALARRRLKVKSQEGVPLKKTGKLTDLFLNSLNFELTAGQKKVIDEITADLARPKPMNRLLQGDVGSGKTVIALYTLLVAVENDYQGAMMVPTEIRADQHYLNHIPVLEKIGVKSGLLTSSIKGSTREEVIKQILNGEAKIVFGTHALIEEGINFKNLGLAIIDEQHRFGVMQRAALVNKGINPHFLVLSATPIPRTLALTLYGDLDISTLTEKPAGRGEVITKLYTEKEKLKVYQFIHTELLKGRQAFVVCPIIEKSEKLELKSVKEVYEEIQSVFSDFTVGLIHGRLNTQERINVMSEFRNGKITILVATTVIEVGVDIPNATIMLILHPERFGLAQLHQLRGRIGRGAERSYCLLILNKFVSPETFERLMFFEKNNDGFALARKDMQLRGPGEILGKRQHGLPDIRIGDLEEDQELLFLARDDAFEIINKDPELRMTEHLPIRKYLKEFSAKEDLLRIG